jgi:hypothetical protein
MLCAGAMRMPEVQRTGPAADASAGAAAATCARELVIIRGQQQQREQLAAEN